MIDFSFQYSPFSCIKLQEMGDGVYSARIASKSWKPLQTYLIAVNWLILNEWLFGSVCLTWW